MVDINWLNQKFQMKAPNEDNDKPKYREIHHWTCLSERDVSQCPCRFETDDEDEITC